MIGAVLPWNEYFGYSYSFSLRAMWEWITVMQPSFLKEDFSFQNIICNNLVPHGKLFHLKDSWPIFVDVLLEEVFFFTYSWSVFYLQLSFFAYSTVLLWSMGWIVSSCVSKEEGPNKSNKTILLQNLPGIQGRKNNININFLVRISSGRPRPLRPDAQGSKSFSPSRGRRQTHFLVRTSTIFFRRGRPWPEGFSKNLVLECRKWGFKRWGFKEIRGYLRKKAFFLRFLDFPGALQALWKGAKKTEKGRQRPISADFRAARHPLNPHLLHPHLRQPNCTEKVCVDFLAPRNVFGKFPLGFLSTRAFSWESGPIFVDVRSIPLTQKWKRSETILFPN